MTLLEAVRGVCSQYGLERTYWIGYSGGLDSQVLLALCHELRSVLPVKFRAIHINHGLSPKAKEWSKHCAQVCRDYAIDYHERVIQIDVSAGDSLEEEARRLRYAVFAECLGEGDVLLTAHQEDDQAETFLVQLLRGAGPKGLAAMPSIKPFANGLHARPLLAFSRATLQQYATSQQLKWLDDESNLNTKLTRNFIRHEILPVLKGRWQTVTTTIARSAQHCAEAQGLLEALVADESKKVIGTVANTLSVNKLLQLDRAQQRSILRFWITQLVFPLPNQKKMAAILDDVLLAGWDRMPCVRWQQTELRRYRDDLYLLPALSPPPKARSFTWDLTHPLSIPTIGTLIASQVTGRGLRANIGLLSIRFRQGGETLNLQDRGHHTLKNLLQEWNVPPWERDRIPLIFVGEQLIAVVGYGVDPDYLATENVLGVDVLLKKTPR